VADDKSHGIAGYVQLLDTLKMNDNVFWVGLRGEREVVFQMALIAVARWRVID
jgi:hypothetical protein